MSQERVTHTQVCCPPQSKTVIYAQILKLFIRFLQDQSVFYPNKFIFFFTKSLNSSLYLYKKIVLFSNKICVFPNQVCTYADQS